MAWSHRYAPPGTPQPAGMTLAYGSLPGEPAALAGATMGTTWSARLIRPAGLGDGQARAAIQAALDSVVAEMSQWESDSAISRYNHAPTGWFDLTPGFAHVLQAALQLASDTDGAYDPTIGPLADLWGFGPGGGISEPPSPQTYETARARCGWNRIAIENGQAWQPGGIALDFSSIAKGYGVDRAIMALRQLGVQDALVEVGGELRSLGKRPDGQPWRVGVEVPDASGRHALPVTLRDLAIATSGDYRRHLPGSYAHYSHTIDPRTGRPVNHGVCSVTVAHPDCMHADALATALTVLGLDKGYAYARQRGLAALFITRTGNALQWRATTPFTSLLGPVNRP